MRTPLAAFVLVALPASPTIAADKSVGKRLCTILEAGPYRSVTPQTSHPDPTSPTGQRSATDEVEFIAQRRVIARASDPGFGIRYRIAAPSSSTVAITTTITFPRQIKGKPRWSRTLDWPNSGGAIIRHVGYDFSHDYERVPGPWTIDVLVDDKPGCSVTFTVK